jgi:hypothetical protein
MFTNLNVVSTFTSVSQPMERGPENKCPLMFEIALMVKISYFGREQHCLSYDGTTASE